MKILVMSDGHGNLEFVERCIADAEEYSNVQSKIYLGDSFGYGIHGKEVMNLMIENGFFCLMGNHEAMLLGILPIEEFKDKIYQLTGEREKLSKKDIKLLRSFYPFLVMERDKRKMLFVHGSPYNPLFGYQYEEKISMLYDYPSYDAVFMGHTHRPFVQAHNNTLYVNVGSCGLPRDIGNSPCYAVYDTESNQCIIKRIVIEKEMIENNFHDVHETVKKCLLRNTERIGEQ